MAYGLLMPAPVIPAKAGIQRGGAGGGNGVLCFSLDTRVRGYDVGRRGSLGGGADGGSLAFAFFVDGSDPDQVLRRSV